MKIDIEELKNNPWTWFALMVLFVFAGVTVAGGITKGIVISCILAAAGSLIKFVLALEG